MAVITKAEAKKLDKFYTKPEVAEYTINKAKEILSLGEDINWLEPSAGNGRFSKILPSCLAYDILPEDESIIKQDFLTLELEQEDFITIGNPPYGKRNELAVEFINHAAKFSKAVIFIIPVTFLKWSVQKQISSNLKLVYTEVLKEDSFTLLEQDFQLRTCLQIWVRKDSFLNLKDLRLEKAPPIALPEEFNIWQHNATLGSRKYIDENWKYATWRQGYKDYNKIFTRNDYEFLKNQVYTTNQQFFYFEPLTKEAEEIFLNMDLNALSLRNMSTPGFGKGDFVQFYLETKKKMIEDAASFS